VTAIIATRSLSKWFGEVVALNGIDLEIGPGITGILGPNGAGKSTTMRMVLGLDRPSAGEALVGGKRYAELRDPLRTVGALLGDPQVLLFDEPVNGLDPEGILWIRRLMQRLAAEGRTVLVSSHLLSEMALTATELVVIGRGRLVAQGPTAQFVDGGADVLVRGPRPDAIAAALRAGGFEVVEEPAGLLVAGATTERIGEAVGAAGLVLHELTLRRGSLEEAFMEITKGDVEYASTGAGVLT